MILDTKQIYKCLNCNICKNQINFEKKININIDIKNIIYGKITTIIF